MHGHQQWRHIVDIKTWTLAMSSYSSSSDSSGAGVLIRPFQVSDQARRELRESLEDGEMMGIWSRFFVWVFAWIWCSCPGKFWKQAWDKKEEWQFILSFTEPFPHSNCCTTVPCPASPKSTEKREREKKTGTERSFNVTSYSNDFHQFSCDFNALSSCSWIQFDDSWWWIISVNHDELCMFRHQSDTIAAHFRHPLLQEHGLVLERRNGYVRLSLVRLKHITVMGSGNPRALEQLSAKTSPWLFSCFSCMSCFFDARCSSIVSRNFGLFCFVNEDFQKNPIPMLFFVEFEEPRHAEIIE